MKEIEKIVFSKEKLSLDTKHLMSILRDRNGENDMMNVIENYLCTLIIHSRLRERQKENDGLNMCMKIKGSTNITVEI